MDTENQVMDLNHRVTIVESKIETIDRHLITQAGILTTIQEDLHKIALTIASAKGWMVAILGTGAIISTVMNWIIKLSEH